MEKLKLNLSNLPGAEILTRELMKKVVGGMYPGGGRGECFIETSCDDGTTIKCNSHGADNNPQGGESCQKVEHLFVNCYNESETNNWLFRNVRTELIINLLTFNIQKGLNTKCYFYLEFYSF